eukprot:Awhi_evm3s12079
MTAQLIYIRGLKELKDIYISSQPREKCINYTITTQLKRRFGSDACRLSDLTSLGSHLSMQICPQQLSEFSVEEENFDKYKCLENEKIDFASESDNTNNNNNNDNNNKNKNTTNNDNVSTSTCNDVISNLDNFIITVMDAMLAFGFEVKTISKDSILFQKNPVPALDFSSSPSLANNFNILNCMKCPFDYSDLFVFCDSGDVENFEKAMQFDFDFSERNSLCLYLACKNGHESIVERLLSKPPSHNETVFSSDPSACND